MKNIDRFEIVSFSLHISTISKCIFETYNLFFFFFFPSGSLAVFFVFFLAHCHSGETSVNLTLERQKGNSKCLTFTLSKCIS